MAIKEKESGGETSPDLNGAINTVLNGLERMLALFRAERLLHLGIGIIAFFVLLGAAAMLLFKPAGLSTTTLVALFGSSGVVTASSVRITYFFNKAYTLYDDIVRALLRVREAGHEESK